MCTHRESGMLRAGLNADYQMDHRGRSQRHVLSILRRMDTRYLSEICWYLAKRTFFIPKYNISETRWHRDKYIRP